MGDVKGAILHLAGFRTYSEPMPTVSVLLLDMSPIRVSITGEAGRIQNRGGVPCVETVLPWKPPRGIWPHELNSFDDDRLMVAPGNIEKGVLARAVGSRDRNQLYRIVSYVVNAVAEG